MIETPHIQKENPEISSSPERRDRPPHSPLKTMFPIFLIKYFGTGNEEFGLLNRAAEAGYHKQITRRQTSDVVEATTLLFQHGDETHYGIHSHLVRLLNAKKRRAEAQIQDIIWKRHIPNLAHFQGSWLRRMEGGLKTWLAQNTVNIISLFQGLSDKPSSIFRRMFKAESAATRLNPESVKSKITKDAGVFSHICRLKSSEVDQENKSTASAAYAQETLLALTQLFLQDISNQGGYTGDIDPNGPSPSAIQSGARELAKTTRNQDIWQSLLPNNPSLASKMEQLLKDPSFISRISTTNCCVDPTIHTVPNPDDTSYDQFKVEDLGLTSNPQTLNNIKVCVFSQDHKKYSMRGLLDIENVTNEQLASLVSAPSLDSDEWQDISTLRNNPTRPTFLLSLTEDENKPRELRDNLDKGGDGMLHLIFNTLPDGTTTFEMDPGHLHIDGGHSAEYFALARSVLPRADMPLDDYLEYRTPLYEGNLKDQGKQLLVEAGLSHLIVGTKYDNLTTDRYLDQINQYRDGQDTANKKNGLSQEIVDVATDFLKTPEFIDNFLELIKVDYPDSYIRRTHIPPQPIQGDIDSLVDALLFLKNIPTENANPNLLKQRDAQIKIIASQTRNILAPKASFVHIFDMIAATKGGVVNCVLPQYEYQRLELAIAAGLTPELMVVLQQYGLLEDDKKDDYLRRHSIELAEMMQIIEINLFEQTLARIGLGTTGYLVNKTGAGKNVAGSLASVFAPEVEAITNGITEQTSYMPILDAPEPTIFNSAGSDFLTNQGGSYGITHTNDKEKPTGFITHKVNLAKSSKYLNRWKPFEAINKMMQVGQKLLPAFYPILVHVATISWDHESHDYFFKQLAKNIAPEKRDELITCIREIYALTVKDQLATDIKDAANLSEMLARYTKLLSPSIRQ